MAINNHSVVPDGIVVDSLEEVALIMQFKAADEDKRKRVSQALVTTNSNIINQLGAILQATDEMNKCVNGANKPLASLVRVLEKR